MKKVLLSFVMMFCAVCFCQAQWQVGGGLQFLKPSGGSSLGIGAEIMIPANENFVLNPSFHYYFEDGTVYAIDADVHYTGLVLNDEVLLNPFAGLNIIDSGTSEIGINIGLHVQAPIGESLTLYVEPKLILVSDFDGFALGAGVFF